jgi:hypothetical protein
MKDFGLKAKDMEKDMKNLRMEISILASLLKEELKEKESESGLTLVKSTKESGIKA